ncbi:MAG: hypothetical protein ACT6S0_04620 [Roseateles sp.]|uniref:hypothetical protein n=1 Tax=Roseateles sp. TaxID=1971397 RepID=UPI0040364C68
MATDLDPNEEDAGALWAEIHRLRAAVQGPDGYETWQQAAVAERVRRVAAEKTLASMSADDLREPKNGTAWRVDWWNESARLMLPAGSKLDSSQSFKNGTLMFTIKRAA